MNKKVIFALSLLLCLNVGCTEQKEHLPTVVVTTNILGSVTTDLLQGVDSIRVESLMGPGVDPHLYKASQGDIEKLSRAKLIIYNGLHLEGKMNDIFKKLRKVETLAAAEAIPESRLINASEYASNYDPHVWFDPTLWAEAVKAIADKLIATFPAHSETISQNRNKLLDSIDQLHINNQLILDNIPDNQRVLITAHDAFKYFGRVYEIEVKGLQGISTAAEYGIQDVSSLVNYIVDNEIKAIFVESSVPKRSIEAVIQGARERGHELKLGGELYSDALGGEGSGAETYISMFEKNVETIASALQ